VTRFARGWSALLLCVAAFAAPALGGETLTPKEHVRGVEQTFLTYPEWFLVFSPAEYAAYVKHATPDSFPFIGHVGQFWEGYTAVTRESHARGQDLNPGYHLMVMVIGLSTTIEYAIRSGYERLIGRVSAATTAEPTPEDRLGAKVAQDYVDFIRVLPWYEFDFARQLNTLWTEVPASGPHMVRKWERRFALTTEYGIKALYGQFIKLATHSIYETPLLVTAAVVQPVPRSDPQRLREMKILQVLPEGAALITVPRYEAFMNYAQALAAQGVDFREIAGNRSIILVSLIGPADWHPRTGIEKELMEQPILTQPGRKRVVATTRVPQLGAALREWGQAGVQVEHIFDY
jgi:hypothetical protein